MIRNVLGQYRETQYTINNGNNNGNKNNGLEKPVGKPRLQRPRTHR